MKDINIISEHVQLIPKLKKRVDELENVRYEKELEYNKLKKNYEKESLDVERLERESFSSFVYKFIGKLDEKYEKERQEMLLAKITLDEIKYQLEHTENESKELKERLGQYLKEREIYNNFILDRKYRLDRKYNDVSSAEHKLYTEKKEYINKLEKEKVELKEAIEAANDAYETANRAVEELKSAENIATYDAFLGGGILADAIKYSKIDTAKLIISELAAKIKKFNREIADVKISSNIHGVELSSMDRTFDVWFDNIFSDMKVRDRIIENKEEIIIISKTIESVRKTLVSRHTNVELELDEKRNELEQFIISIDM